MVARLFATVFFTFVLASLGAEDLVPRVVGLSLNTERPDKAFLGEVIKTSLASDGLFLVAEDGDRADATLILTPGTSLEVKFHDTLDPSKDWSRTLQLASVTAKTLRAALDSLIPTLRQSLAMIAPHVKEVVTERVVQETQIDRKEKGLTVTVRGTPGSTLSFDGHSVVIPAEGTVVVPDLVQHSALLLAGHAPGYYNRSLSLNLEDKDLEVDLSLEALPRWSVGVGLGSNPLNLLTVAYRPTDGPFLVVGQLDTMYPGFTMSTYVTEFDTNRLGLPAGPLPIVQWLQAEAGALWYGSQPEEFFQWGFQGLATLRWDAMAEGWQLSSWFPWGLRADALAEVRLTRWLSAGLSLGSWLAYSTAKLADLEPDDISNDRPQIEVYGYNYADGSEDLVALVPGQFYLRPLFGALTLRLWF